MDFLALLYVSIISLLIIGSVLIFKSKSIKIQNYAFYSLVLLSLFVTFLNVTSLPSNYLIQRGISILIGLITIPALIIRLKTPQKTSMSNLLITVSVLCGVIDLIFF